MRACRCEGTKTDYTSLTNLVLRELAATARALAADAEAEIEARSAPFPASLPPWLVQWLPIREVPRRCAWPGRGGQTSALFSRLRGAHRSLVSVAGCGSVYFKWENHVKSLIQSSRPGQLTEFQQQVFRHYELDKETRDRSDFRFIPIGVIAAVRGKLVNDRRAGQDRCRESGVPAQIGGLRLLARGTGSTL